MKKYLMVLSSLFLLSLMTAGISAADAHIFTDVSDNVLLTIGTDGSGNFTGDIMENSVRLSDTYCALTGGCDLAGPVVITGDLNVSGNVNISGTFIGDGSGLTGVTVSMTDNSTQIAYQNITNFPTCSANEFFSFDGSVLTCVAVSIPANSTTLDASNITSGVFDVARIPTLVNQTTIAYQNISNLPTCTGDDVLTFDGTDMTCTTPASSMDYTNLALTNETNVFVPEQNFTGGINTDENILIADTKLVEWTGGGSVSATSGVITYKAGV